MLDIPTTLHQEIGTRGLLLATVAVLAIGSVLAYLSLWVARVMSTLPVTGRAPFWALVIVAVFDVSAAWALVLEAAGRFAGR